MALTRLDGGNSPRALGAGEPLSSAGSSIFQRSPTHTVGEGSGSCIGGRDDTGDRYTNHGS